MNAGPRAGRRASTSVLAALALILSAAALATAAEASTGGLAATAARTEIPAIPPAPEAPTGSAPTAEPPVATGSRLSALIGGRAVAPLGAPPVVKRVIDAANRIRTTPYVWGGGHRSWSSRGYDCSGSVSYALHGGGLLGSPLVSGSFMGWGAPGPGRWITIYANGGHVYAVIAGLRWDTSGNARGTGPRWHRSPPYPRGFAVRHPLGY
jgi:cell wall-associated NlpC family hydrolase